MVSGQWGLRRWRRVARSMSSTTRRSGCIFAQRLRTLLCSWPQTRALIPTFRNSLTSVVLPDAHGPTTTIERVAGGSARTGWFLAESGSADMHFEPQPAHGNVGVSG